MSKHTKLLYAVHSGSSMNPTLKKGDILAIVPYNGEKVKKGDIIVFFSEEKGKYVTHRVISADSQTIRTLGDNNSGVDNCILSYANVVGRAVYALRQQRKTRIYGGILGYLYAKAFRSTSRIRKCLFSAMSYGYGHAPKWNLRRYVFPSLKTKIVVFNRPGGAEKQLLLGRRVIGRNLPGTNRWHISPPFHLFVNKSSLRPQDQDH